METHEAVEIGNWAMLVEHGLDANVAKRITKQYMDKCAEAQRLRDVLTWSEENCPGKCTGRIREALNDQPAHAPSRPETP